MQAQGGRVPPAILVTRPEHVNQMWRNGVVLLTRYPNPNPNLNPDSKPNPNPIFILQLLYP